MQERLKKNKDELFGASGGAGKNRFMQGLKKVGEFFNVEEGLERQSRASPPQQRADGYSAKDDASTGKVKAKSDNAMVAAGEAKNRLLERGEKLNDLGEKSERLKDQSRAFADMARQLNKQEKGWWG